MKFGVYAASKLLYQSEADLVSLRVSVPSYPSRTFAFTAKHLAWGCSMGLRHKSYDLCGLQKNNFGFDFQRW